MGKHLNKGPEIKGVEELESLNLAKAMNECLWVGDKNHKTLYVNPTFEKISGYSLAECVGKDCVSFFDEEGKRIINEHHKIRVRGKSSQYQATMISKKGEKIPLLISGAPTKNGGTIGVFTNLSKIKELSQKDRIAGQVVKNAAEGIVVLDEKFKITLWNSGAEVLFGYSEKEILGKDVEVLMPKGTKDDYKKLMELVAERNYVRDVELKQITKNKEEVDSLITISKVTGEDNELIGYLVICSNITKHKKINSELQKRLEAIQDAYKELGVQRRENDYLCQISEVAVSGKPLSVLENLIVSSICLLTKSDAAILRLYDKKKDDMVLRASLGVDSKWKSKSRIPFKNGVAEDAFKGRRSLIFDDIAAYPKYRGLRLLKSHKFTSLIIVPLFVEDEPVGSISLYAKDPASFRLFETEFLESFSKHASLALYVKASKEKWAHVEK